VGAGHGAEERRSLRRGDETFVELRVELLHGDLRHSALRVKATGCRATHPSTITGSSQARRTSRTSKGSSPSASRSTASISSSIQPASARVMDAARRRSLPEAGIVVTQPIVFSPAR
jgi:hypothetical protein